ncbi:MAG: hypothetical protein LV471_07985 [Nitrosomonas sp.]|nr:hypothetical protein [Nitrosomonas sp.]
MLSECRVGGVSRCVLNALSEAFASKNNIVFNSRKPHHVIALNAPPFVLTIARQNASLLSFPAGSRQNEEE